jgi:hypothetical protein
VKKTEKKAQKVGEKGLNMNYGPAQKKEGNAVIRMGSQSLEFLGIKGIDGDVAFMYRESNQQLE